MNAAPITIPYTPRPAFSAYHATDKRFGVTVAHRRAGKTVARVNRLIRAAVTNTKPRPRFGYLAPYYVQAKDIAWAYMKHYAAPVLAAVGGSTNESELSITFGHNGAAVRLYGAENAERMRGLYFDGIVVDEAQGIARRVLTEVILPALADREGWLDVSGTPKGWENLLGELVRMAQAKPDEWFLQILRASETGILPAEELARQRQLMSENEYEQEFECSFEAAITGAVYGLQLAAAAKDGRIGIVPHVPGVPINTAWDLGFDDATAIWWWQQVGREIRLLDYYEASGRDIAHYCQVISERARSDAGYGKHYVPHDAANQLLAAGGRSIVQQAHAYGVKMQVVPATSQQNGIEAARLTLEHCWFDEPHVGKGLDALRNYQFEWDADRKVFRSKPRHDWASHGADAFEIIGQVWRQQRAEVAPPDPRFFPNVTARDVFWPESAGRQVERV